MLAPYAPLSLEAALLGDVRYWQDNRLSWKRTKSRPDGTKRVSRPRTPAEDRDLSNRYVRLLDRIAERDKKAKSIADQLDGCSRRHPCGNAACPACLGAFQHGLVSVVSRFMKDVDPGKDSIFAVSLIPATEMVGRSRLAALDSVNFRRRMRERLQPLTADCAWMMLGVDISLNYDEQKRWKPHWCLHLYGFVRTKLSKKELKAKLKTLFPAELPRVARPVKVNVFEPSRYGTSYLLKPDFKRRITYAHSTGDRSKKAPLRTGRRSELQQVLLWLGDTAITDRLLLIGVKTVRRTDGVKIVPVAGSRAGRVVKGYEYGPKAKPKPSTHLLDWTSLDGFSPVSNRWKITVKIVPLSELLSRRVPYRHNSVKAAVPVVAGAFKPVSRRYW